MNRRLGILSILFLVSFAAACGSNPPSSTGTPIDSGLAVATFDSAWSIIHRTHFDPEFEGVDWIAVREELRPRASEVTTQEELRELLNDMIARIGLSHFGVIPRSAIDAMAGDDGEDGPGGSADVGIDVRLVGDQILVWKVRPGSPADRAGVGTGWVLRSIEGRDLADRLQKARASIDEAELEIMFAQLAPSWLQGAAGSSVELVLLDGDDREHTSTLERETPPGEMNRFGNLPPLRVDVTQQERTIDGRRIGVIGFNIWLMPVAARFDRAIDDYRDADGIVVDLRGNLGGIGGMAMGIGGHFLDERLSLGVMTTRQASLEFRVNPRRANAAGERVEPFDGPVAILVDQLSMSTSEIFAQGMKVIGRARVFGQPTPGAALPSAITALPNGDALQHAFADFVDPEGRRLEKNGVVPDEIVPLTREDLLAGRDAPLEAALAWIAAQNPDVGR